MTKIFRRMTEYLKLHEKFNGNEFTKFLAQKNQPMLQLKILHFTYFHH